MKISTTLTRTRALIANPARWCKGYSAVDKNGLGIQPARKDAVAWCARGALRRIEGIDGPAEAFMTGLLSGFDRCLSNWNNEADNHAEVMLGFDLAIIVAKEDGL